jgi:trigger factor
LADEQSIKHTLEVTVPAAEVESETVRVVDDIRKKARLPGFRPGKVPPDLIRRRWEEEIRKEVIEKLVPKHFFQRAEEQGFAVVGTPNISDVHFHAGEPLSFKVEFEVAPQIELGEYKGVAVPYQDPVVTDEDVEKRVGMIRDQKAQFVNIDPRPAAAGDFVVASLESLSGIAPQVKQDEVVLEIGGADTLSAFTENLMGAAPGEEREFDVAYPEDFGQAKLAGKTVRFRVVLKAIRRKDLPELNDEFAQEVGDYKSMDELREAVRAAIFAERQFFAQQEAKNKLVDKLVQTHQFPVPEAYVERQIEMQVERHLQSLAAEGVDPRTVKLDWKKIMESQRVKAVEEVKASLLINRVAEAENIHTTQEELDREVQRIARQEREPVAAVRKRLEKDDGLRRIASRIRTEKTLNFLFEHARKEAEG